MKTFNKDNQTKHDRKQHESTVQWVLWKT